MVNNYLEERSKEYEKLLENSKTVGFVIASHAGISKKEMKGRRFDKIEDDEDWDFIRLIMFEDEAGDKWKIELRYGEDMYKEAVVYKNNQVYTEYRYVVVGVDKKTNEIHDWVETPNVSSSSK